VNDAERVSYFVGVAELHGRDALILQPFRNFASVERHLRTIAAQVVHDLQYIGVSLAWIIHELLSFLGSAQQSDERRILSGFPESDEFGLGGGQPLCFQQEIIQIAVAPATT